MQSYIDVVKGFCKSIVHTDNPLSYKAITKKNFPYFIGWVSVFIWLYSYFLPMGEFRFQSRLYNENVGDSMIYFYAWLFSGGLIPLLFDVKKFVSKTIYSVILTILCFGAIRFTGPGILSQGIMVVASICIGHMFASYVYGFFMVLNNSEKFYSMVLATLLPRILMFGKPFLNKMDSNIDAANIIIVIIMLILLICSYSLRTETFSVPSSPNTKAPINAYSLMPLVFVVLTLNDVIAPSALHHMAAGIPEKQIENFYFLGTLIGILIVIFFQKRYSINIYNMLSISFALLATGFTINLVSMQNTSMGHLSALCFGCSYAIGIVNIYYLAGFMAKKFQSITFYRVGIFLSVFYYLIGFFLQAVFKESELLAPSASLAVISIAIVLFFFILSPLFIRMLYLGEWIDDTYRPDVTKCSRLEAYLKELKLTPAEVEVCKLLLDGYTLRQISGIQSKAYATINTYCTSIYRKLNINSRTELILFLQDYIT